MISAVIVTAVLLYSVEGGDWTHYEENYGADAELRGMELADSYSSEDNVHRGEHAYKGRLLQGVPQTMSFFLDERQPFDEDFVEKREIKKTNLEKRSSQRMKVGSQSSFHSRREHPNSKNWVKRKITERHDKRTTNRKQRHDRKFQVSSRREKRKKKAYEKYTKGHVVRKVRNLSHKRPSRNTAISSHKTPKTLSKKHHLSHEKIEHLPTLDDGEFPKDKKSKIEVKNSLENTFESSGSVHNSKEHQKVGEDPHNEIKIMSKVEQKRSETSHHPFKESDESSGFEKRDINSETVSTNIRGAESKFTHQRESCKQGDNTIEDNEISTKEEKHKTDNLFNGKTTLSEGKGNGLDSKNSEINSHPEYEREAQPLPSSKKDNSPQVSGVTENLHSNSNAFSNKQIVNKNEMYSGSESQSRNRKQSCDDTKDDSWENSINLKQKATQEEEILDQPKSQVKVDETRNIDEINTENGQETQSLTYEESIKNTAKERSLDYLESIQFKSNCQNMQENISSPQNQTDTLGAHSTKRYEEAEDEKKHFEGNSNFNMMVSEEEPIGTTKYDSLSVVNSNSRGKSYKNDISKYEKQDEVQLTGTTEDSQEATEMQHVLSNEQDKLAKLNLKDGVENLNLQSNSFQEHSDFISGIGNDADSIGSLDSSGLKATATNENLKTEENEEVDSKLENLTNKAFQLEENGMDNNKEDIQESERGDKEVEILSDTHKSSSLNQNKYTDLKILDIKNEDDRDRETSNKDLKMKLYDEADSFGGPNNSTDSYSRPIIRRAKRNPTKAVIPKKAGIILSGKRSLGIKEKLKKRGNGKKRNSPHDNNDDMENDGDDDSEEDSDCEDEVDEDEEVESNDGDYEEDEGDIDEDDDYVVDISISSKEKGDKRKSKARTGF